MIARARASTARLRRRPFAPSRSPRCSRTNARAISTHARVDRHTGARVSMRPHRRDSSARTARFGWRVLVAALLPSACAAQACSECGDARALDNSNPPMKKSFPFSSTSSRRSGSVTNDTSMAHEPHARASSHSEHACAALRGERGGAVRRHRLRQTRVQILLCKSARAAAAAAAVPTAAPARRRAGLSLIHISEPTRPY